MSVINLLDDNTIDKIAAGEVVERPSSVVKELIENSIDSGATAITVEIKNGGIEFIRITDNGIGIAKDDVRKAFLRHATSKIITIDDLLSVSSMGFRGEALASISSVSKVELISKQSDSLMGIRYEIHGGKEISLDEVGAPNGTTIIVKNLFYNTPARRKFLKSESSEAAHIADIVEHLSLCRPDISFTFINSSKTKITTSGNRDLKEVIYRIYGRDTSKEIIPISYEENGITVEGYIGTPSINRPSRNYETYFINNRYIQNNIVAKSIEEGYKAYLMQHKFPFCVLHISMDSSELDVNVHPAKLEVRFNNKEEFANVISNAVKSTLANNEMIPSFEINDSKNLKEAISYEKIEPFETNRIIENTSDFENDKSDDVLNNESADENIISSNNELIFDVGFSDEEEADNPVDYFDTNSSKQVASYANPHFKITSENQFSMFDNEVVLSEESRKDYILLGQVFDTYWIISFKDKLYFVDQHAAHEKVNYEKIMKRVENGEVYNQALNPPIIVTLTPKESIILSENIDTFSKLGFEIEEYGGGEYALRSVPLELYFNNPKDMFLEIMKECEEYGLKGTPDVITSRVATMACKASVKGGMKVSIEEMETLLDELLKLENPYHCPHGRPTIFSMSKYELEKKFKRIVE